MSWYNNQPFWKLAIIWSVLGLILVTIFFFIVSGGQIDATVFGLVVGAPIGFASFCYSWGRWRHDREENKRKDANYE